MEDISEQLLLNKLGRLAGGGYSCRKSHGPEVVKAGPSFLIGGCAGQALLKLFGKRGLDLEERVLSGMFDLKSPCVKE